MPTAPPVPFELRGLVLLPLSAWLIAVAIAAVACLSCLGLLALSDAPLVTGDLVSGFHITGQAHVAILTGAALGYLCGTGVYFARRADGGPGSSARWGLAAGAAGVLVCVFIIRATTAAIRLQEPGRDPWSAGELALDTVALLLFWGIGRAIHFTVLSSHRSRAAQADVDLLALVALYPLAQSGLRAALAWIGGISLVVGIMAFDPNPAVLRSAGHIILLAIAASVLTGSFALFMPLWQLKRRIAREKEQQIRRTLLQLRALRDDEHTPPGLEADLLARHAYLSTLREWPIDLDTLRRFGFYVFFPAVSWMVATVTQRLLDTVLIGDLVRYVLSTLQ